MPPLADLLMKGKPVEPHRPWPRVTVTAEVWQGIANELAAGRAILLGLWGDNPPAVHMAIMSDDGRQNAVVTFNCPGGSFPSVSAVHPPAIRLERATFSLYGLEPIGAPDTRPWLDLGFWDVRYPLGASSPAPTARADYTFLPVEGESLHQVAVGPIHAGIIEPGHFRFTAGGETVARLEQRLGYLHKGIESHMAGATIERAAQLAARTSGDSTVAYGIAFAHAVEAALKVAPPPRAQYLRALMAELERLANHLGDIGAICNDASFALMHAHCGILRERVLRSADVAFGHRLMMDRVVPGGVTVDLDAAGTAGIWEGLHEIYQRFPRLVELYDKTASLQDRTVGSGIVTAELARQFGAGGYVGRASGRHFDARKTPGYAPYDQLDFSVPEFAAGDVDARVWVRIREVEQSLALIEQILTRLPSGPIRTPIAVGNGEGLGFVEGFRGDILAWVRVDGMHVERCHLRDPSWFQWPLLEAAIEGNIVADFPLCNKSFNCSYSGHDL
jgi:Ni,Fe-hydrogenase III large subunit/Ni,Fe-hydrogenase III component G